MEYLHALQQSGERLQPREALSVLLCVHHLRLHLQFRHDRSRPPPMTQHQVLKCQHTGCLDYKPLQEAFNVNCYCLTLETSDYDTTG